MPSRYTGPKSSVMLLLATIREQQRLRQLVTVTCNLQFHSAYNALIDLVVYAVLPCSGVIPGRASSPDPGHRRLHVDDQCVPHCRRGRRGGGPQRATAVAYRSRTHVELSVAPTSRAKLAPQPPVTGLHEDHSIELNLLEIGDYIAEHDLGRFDVIEAIRSHDADHQTDFLITLRAYLDANGNIAQAAKRLHVHGNTIRYRIARLAEDFQVDVDKSATRLWLWLRLASQRD